MVVHANTPMAGERLSYVFTALFGVALCAAVSCGDKKAPATGKVEPVAAVEPAGVVRALQGQVTARRASAEQRDLKVDDPIWADDTVTTAAEASVTIALHHNGAVWTLLGGRSKRVDASAAWRAKKGSAPLLKVAMRDDLTAAAGRHSENEAATSQESAMRKPVAAAQPKASKKRARKRKSKPALRKELKSKSVLHMLGTAGKGRTITDALGGSKGGSIDDAFKDSGGVRMGGSGGTIGGLSKGSGGLAAKKAERAPRAKMKLKTDALHGALPKPQVERVLRRRMRSLRYCYEKSLRFRPDLAGLLRVKLIINKGRVVSASVVKDTIGDKSVAACVLAKVRRWRFPASEDGARASVIFSMRFEPGS